MIVGFVWWQGQKNQSDAGHYNNAETCTLVGGAIGRVLLADMNPPFLNPLSFAIAHAPDPMTFANAPAGTGNA